MYLLNSHIRGYTRHAAGGALPEGRMAVMAMMARSAQRAWPSEEGGDATFRPGRVKGIFHRTTVRSKPFQALRLPPKSGPDRTDDHAPPRRHRPDANREEWGAIDHPPPPPARARSRVARAPSPKMGRHRHGLARLRLQRPSTRPGLRHVCPARPRLGPGRGALGSEGDG